MKWTLVVLLAAVAASGCGSGSSDPLQGTWVDNPGTAAAVQAIFKGDAWEIDTISVLTTGSTGLESDSGTYVLSGSTIMFTTTKSSCEGVDTVAKTFTATFSTQGQSLTMNLGTTVLLFQKATAPPQGMGGASVGCFDSQGNFTVNPIKTVP